MKNNSFQKASAAVRLKSNAYSNRIWCSQ